MGTSGIDPNTIIIALSTIIAAIITGVFKIIVVIITHSKGEGQRIEGETKGERTARISRRVPTWRSYISLALIVFMVGIIIGKLITSPEVPSRGNVIMKIGFNQVGDGNCNDYDPDRLGYESGKYYIQSDPDRPYIAICHEIKDLSPSGDLEVSAYSFGNLSSKDTFGYGVLFGWGGAGRSTSDACIAGILRYKDNTFAYFTEVVDDKWNQDNELVNSIKLDTAQHTLRVVMQTDGKAAVFLDGRKLAEHKFTKCSPGPIGISAWNSLGNKVYFDDLTLYSLP